MGTRYNIAITATDGATARVRAIKSAIAQTILPINQVGRSVKALGKELGVDKLAQGFVGLSRGAAAAMKNIGGVGGAVAGAIGIGSISALGVYAKQWLNAGSATLRFSQISGVASTKVQDLRGAAKLAGLQAEDMDSSIEQLGSTIQDARWGRNQGALIMMGKLGMRMRYTKTGAVDTTASLHDLADALHDLKAPVQTKALIARQFGVEALLPLLLKGGKAMDDLAAKSRALRPAISDDDLKKMDQMRMKTDALGLSFEALGNRMALAAAPTVGGWADYWTDRLDATSDAIKKNGFWTTIGRNALHNTGTILGLNGQGFSPRKADKGKEREAITDYRRLGYDDAHAKAMAANEVHESSMDPRAVGDGGQAKGLFQWHKPRRQDYEAWAATQRDVGGKTIETASAFEQRRFMDFELRHGKEQAAGRKFLAATTPEDAAAVLSMQAIRPAGGLGEGVRRGVTARDLDKLFPAQPGNATSQPALPWKPPAHPQAGPPVAQQGGQDRGAGALSDLWKTTQPAKAAEQTVHLKITTPPGTKAEVTDARGPVKTTLKTESTMPDFT